LYFSNLFLLTYKFLKKRLLLQTYKDHELLNKYKETLDAEYFGILYSRYIPLLYGLCLKYFKDEYKAQDAVMQVFENLLTKILEYNIDNFKSWVYKVSKNHCLQQLRAENKEIKIDFNLDIVESEDILHLLDEKEGVKKYSILEECISKLPEPQKISIVSFFFNDKSYRDICDATQYSLKSVKSYIQNGKRNLKFCLEKKLK
jgi:RNA polymerase sigma-70 factor, ECF subfamily